jgi:hypothetical protein
MTNDDLKPSGIGMATTPLTGLRAFALCELIALRVRDRHSDTVVREICQIIADEIDELGAAWMAFTDSHSAE